MRSQYQCSSSQQREAAQDALVAHGYDDVFCADTSGGRPLVVIPDDIYAGRVDYIVYRVDPTAQRTARSTTD